MIDIKQFIGGMDQDSPNEDIPKGLVREARNIFWRGLPPNMRAEGMPGTNIISNPYLPVTGSNVAIKGYYDAVNNRIFQFNYNTAGFHGIYIFYTLLDSWQRLMEEGINADSGVLGFNNTIRIHSVDIIYGDDDSGDLLFYVDAQKRPRKLNINRILAGTYPTVKDSYIKVIKAPPIPPPYCVYENDANVTSNNLVNKLFNFSCSHIYDDFEESVLGSGARQPLPPDPFDPTNNSPQTRCARISIYVPTGDANVKKIRIYGKQVKDGTTSDWFVIDTLIKSDLGIGDNTVYRYWFYNNARYVPAAASIYANNNPVDGQLDYDYVPLKANTQSLLNGDVVAYGGLTEGYDYLNPSFGITTSNIVAPQFSANGLLFFAAPNGQFTSGQPQITMYLVGAGINNGSGEVTDLEKAPANLNVHAKSNGTSINFTYNNPGGNRNIPTLLFNLRGAAQSAGWIFVSNTVNTLTMYYPTGNIVLQSSYYQGISANVSPYAAPVSTHFPEANYAYGVLYRDIDGRTNGVISNVTGNVRTQLRGSAGQIPYFQIGLGGFTPPLWAAYYEIVRTDNLTYDYRLDWVSASAFSGLGSFNNLQYAYIGVNNIADYNSQIKASEGVVSYGFKQGDRIRITGRYTASGSFVSLNYDYAVLGTQTQIVVNGETKTGLFVQINYPAGDISGDPNLKFDGTDDFQNYQIMLYNYKAYSSDSQNVYWQIGQQYGIGNPATLSAYHMGNAGDNQVNLTDGDVFYRVRNVPIINSYRVPCGAYTQGTTYGTEWVAPNLEGFLFADNAIWRIRGGVNRNGGLLPAQTPFYSDADQTVWNKSGTPFSVRLRQTVFITDVNDPNGQWAMYVKIVDSGGAVTTYNILPLKSGLAENIQNEYSFDFTFSLPGNSKLWIMGYAVNQMLVGLGELQIDIIRTRTINVFDFSFSDIFDLKTNSDNKPNVIQTYSRQTFYGTKYRWGQVYQLGTSINNSNRFFPLDFDEIDKSAGQIQRMYAWKRELRFFQELKTGHTGIYAKFIKDNNGDNTLITTDSIISKNNVEYFEGQFGIGNQPCSLVCSGYQNYFPDPIKGRILRVSLDGVKDISEEFRLLSFTGPNLPNYLNPYNYQFAGTSCIVGAYVFNEDKEGEVVFGFQGGVNQRLDFVGPGSSTLTFPAHLFFGTSSISGTSLSFNEKNNSFQSFYDFVPDELVCAGNQLYSFYNGVMYRHDNTSQYCNFYGTQYYPSIKMIFNDQMPIKKTFETIAYKGNQFWEAFNVGDIVTSQPNPQTGLPQISQLLSVDTEINEGDYFAALNRDANSMSNPAIAINEGDYLKGSWISVKLTYRGSQFAWIYLPLIKNNLSPKTP